jgi:multidrug efflux pump subunit AcrB
MLFDPIFQGLALAMMFGAVTATLLTLIAVPILYFELRPWITEKNDDIE